MTFPLVSLAWRESRTTRRRLLLYMSSISLGVAALVGIDSYAENINDSVRQQSKALVGGDLSMRSQQTWTPVMDSLFATFPARGADVAKLTSFASMALVPRSGSTRLAQVRALSPLYPLYGTVTTRPAGAWRALQTGMNVLVDPALLISLNARPGDSISLGSARFLIAGEVTSIPGDPGIASAIAPRIYVADRHVAATKLLVYGSRGEYEAFVRISRGTPEELLKSIQTTLDSNKVRARTVQQSELGITRSIDDLSDFLGIVGVIALLLGGIGVASGVHAWVRRKIDTVAVLRCLGATSRQVMWIYVSQAALMGLVGALVGVALGLVIQFSLPGAAKDFLPVDVVVRIAPQAILMGIALGVWIALAFALRPLLALRRVSPLQALRRDTSPVRSKGWWKDGARLAVNGLLALSVVGVAATRSQSPQEVVAFSAGIAVVLGLLALSAASLSQLARRSVRGAWPYLVRQGVANLYRPANQTRSVVLSLGFGAFLMTTLFLVQSNLLRQISITEMASRGNLVFFDVQEDQVNGLDSIARAQQQDVLDRTPIVTMRIVAINGRPVTQVLSDSSVRRESWTLRREYRSSYRGELSSAEKVLRGKWHGPKVAAAGTQVFEVSLEDDLARNMGVNLGDTITWNVQGTEVRTRLTSTRDVDWARFEANFFAIFQPGALEAAPKMFALLVRTPDDAATARLQRASVERYPNVASIDLSLVQRTVGDISRKATLAIRFLSLFSLAMGIPVLFSAVAATRRERVREGVLLKVLGATRRQIRRILFSEYVALGILGSLTGMVLAFGGAWALMRFVFESPFSASVGTPLLIATAMLVLTVSIGLLSGRDLFNETPLGALREV
jgi:putative ABC transport system permease protein